VLALANLLGTPWAGVGLHYCRNAGHVDSNAAGGRDGRSFNRNEPGRSLDRQRHIAQTRVQASGSAARILSHGNVKV
jgi:hypothetical protein